jgi:hypothetical protein
MSRRKEFIKIALLSSALITVPAWAMNPVNWSDINDQESPKNPVYEAAPFTIDGDEGGEPTQNTKEEKPQENIQKPEQNPMDLLPDFVAKLNLENQKRQGAEDTHEETKEGNIDKNKQKDEFSRKAKENFLNSWISGLENFRKLNSRRSSEIPYINEHYMLNLSTE